MPLLYILMAFVVALIVAAAHPIRARYVDSICFVFTIIVVGVAAVRYYF